MSVIDKFRTPWPVLARWGLSVLVAASFVVSLVNLFGDNTSLARFWALTALVLLALRQLLANSDVLSGLHARLDSLDRGQTGLTELYRRRAWGEKDEGQ